MAAMASASHALEIAVTPGSLVSELPALVNTQDKSLVLKGTAGEEDLALVSRMSHTVTTLDMSGLTIVTGAIPQHMLTGSKVSVFRFPEGVTAIGESAFAGSNLRVVTLPESVTHVGDYAFASCPQLTAIRFLSMPELGSGVFKDCVALTTVEMPLEMTVVPESMFEGCVSYSQSPSEDVVSVGAYAYRGTAVERLDLMRAERLGDFCFADMSALSEINIDLSHDLEVGTGVFYNDGAVGMIPHWQGNMPDLALAYSSGRQKEPISSEVIGEAAFANNTDIGYVALSSGVREIKAHAFRNLLSLEQVDVRALGKNIPEVDPLAFSGLENADGRYDIILNVEKDTNNEWKEHPVWGLFNILNLDTGVVDNTDLGGYAMTIVRDGVTVSVSAGSPIDYLGVFALDGTVLHESRPAATEGEALLPDGSGVIVVKAVSAGREKVVKLR